MYKTILVPLDGSKRAEAILPYVESLAGCCGSKVIFFGVVEPLPVMVAYHDMIPQFDQDEIMRRTDEMEAYLVAQQGAFRDKGFQAELEVRHGPVVEEIIAAAEREEVDLIAMASHGRTGLPRVFYGSVAAGVLHRVDHPLLLIRSLDNE